MTTGDATTRDAVVAVATTGDAVVIASVAGPPTGAVVVAVINDGAEAVSLYLAAGSDTSIPRPASPASVSVVSVETFVTLEIE